MLTDTKEDYLRAISKLEIKEQRNVKSKELADYLKLAKSTVSERLKELAEKKLIKQNPYGPVHFTAKGRKIANELNYKHRLIEVFLTKTLKMNKLQAHHEAHKLEHALSDDVAKRLSKLLNNPKKCPHGQPLINPLEVKK